VSKKRFFWLSVVLTFVGLVAAGSWFAGSQIVSPAEAAARTAAPAPSPILVPIEQRVLSSNIVTRGTARFGLPKSIAIAPSALKSKPGLITTLPLRSAQLEEGGVMLTASGRPVFVLQGEVPAYRDLVPGISGDDVLQLEQGLHRLGFSPGPIDRTYDQRTSEAVAKWYASTGTGWEPFGPTLEQLTQIRTLEQDLAAARKHEMATAAAAAAAALTLESARATAEHALQVAAAEVDAAIAARDEFNSNGKAESVRQLVVHSARAAADHAEKAAQAEIATKIADRALISLDPRATATARAAADKQLEVARAGLYAAQLQNAVDLQSAQRTAKSSERQIEMARAAVKAKMLENKLAVQSALDAQNIAEFDAKLATQLADRLAADLELVQRSVGVQVPVDEIVFIPSLPVRVEQLTAVVGDAAAGPVMTVTDNQLAIDSSLALDAAPLVKPEMPVFIDEQALGISAKGVVQRVASTPGTFGVDGYHIYFEVRVVETLNRLEGFSLRLTIPIESTNGMVTAVPTSALSLAADGTSRIQVENDGALEYIVVEPGLSADGYVEVKPLQGSLQPGQLVVIGFENNGDQDPS
jgi:hypothetical protein